MEHFVKPIEHMIHSQGTMICQYIEHEIEKRDKIISDKNTQIDELKDEIEQLTKHSIIKHLSNKLHRVETELALYKKKDTEKCVTEQDHPGNDTGSVTEEEDEDDSSYLIDIDDTEYLVEDDVIYTFFDSTKGKRVGVIHDDEAIID